MRSDWLRGFIDLDEQDAITDQPTTAIQQSVRNIFTTTDVLKSVAHLDQVMRPIAKARDAW